MTWLRKLFGVIDRDFVETFQSGRCEANFGYHMGMLVTCGTRTNHRHPKYTSMWACLKHQQGGERA